MTARPAVPACLLLTGLLLSSALVELSACSTDTVDATTATGVSDGGSVDVSDATAMEPEGSLPYVRTRTDGTTEVRVLNAALVPPSESSDGGGADGGAVIDAPLDVYVDGDGATPYATGLALLQPSSSAAPGYFAVPSGRGRFVARPKGSGPSGPVVATSEAVDLEVAGRLTLLVTGATTAPVLTAVREHLVDPPAGKATVKLVNATGVDGLRLVLPPATEPYAIMTGVAGDDEGIALPAPASSTLPLQLYVGTSLTPLPDLTFTSRELLAGEKDFVVFFPGRALIVPASGPLRWLGRNPTLAVIAPGFPDDAAPTGVLVNGAGSVVKLAPSEAGVPLVVASTQFQFSLGTYPSGPLLADHDYLGFFFVGIPSVGASLPTFRFQVFPVPAPPTGVGFRFGVVLVGESQPVKIAFHGFVDPDHGDYTEVVTFLSGLVSPGFVSPPEGLLAPHSPGKIDNIRLVNAAGETVDTPYYRPIGNADHQFAALAVSWRKGTIPQLFVYPLTEPPAGGWTPESVPHP